jgi:hypothetical protein
MIEIAGLIFTGAGLINDLLSTYRDVNAWDERDLPVDSDWLQLAIEKGLLPKADYVWSAIESAPTRELRGTHQVVVAHSEDKKMLYRIVWGNLILMNRNGQT